MNAAVVSSYDVPPRYRTFEEPVAGEGEVLVNVSAAGLHPIVKALANGTHYGSTGVLPFVPGVDGVGRLADGRRVFFGVARSPFGTFAERTVAAAAMYLELPEGLEDAVAAGLANPGMSSWAALKARAKFVAGESVLILGATGVAGQLGGADCEAAGGEEGDCGGTESGGAGEVEGAGGGCGDLAGAGDGVRWWRRFAGRLRVMGGCGAGLSLGCAGGELCWRRLRRRGCRMSSPRIRFVQIGNSAGPTITLAGATLRSSGVELLGSGFGSASLTEIFAAVGEFFKEAAARPFDVEIKTVALKDVEAVWGEAEKGDSGCVSALSAVPPPPSILRKVFKAGALSPDFGVRRSKKSYKMGLVAAKYS